MIRVRRDLAVRARSVARLVALVLTRRRIQTIVIGLVLVISTAASAQVTVTADLTRVTAGQLAATARLPEVTAAAGPFAETGARNAGRSAERGRAAARRVNVP